MENCHWGVKPSTTQIIFLRLGGENSNGDIVPIEDLIVNVNAEPVPVLLRCNGMEPGQGQDTPDAQGRALINTYCDYNLDEEPQDDEFYSEIVIKKRNGMCSFTKK